MDMREIFRQRAQGAVKRVEAPFAKYNATGHLICVACNQHIKSEKLWGAHTHGLAHKQSVAAAQTPEPATKLQKAADEPLLLATGVQIEPMPHAPGPVAATAEPVPLNTPRLLPSGFFDAAVSIPKRTTVAPPTGQITVAPNARPAQNDSATSDAVAREDVQGDEDGELEADLLQRYADEEMDQTLLLRRVVQIREQQGAIVAAARAAPPAVVPLKRSVHPDDGNDKDEDEDDDEDDEAGEDDLFSWRKRGL